MVSREEGVIKYDRSGFQRTEALPKADYIDLESWREKLFKLALIGEYEDLKVGYGNISMLKNLSHLHQFNGPQFIITGTQTGKYPHLTGEHYTQVVAHDVAQSKLKSCGPLEPSSEALTHASIYLAAPTVAAIFHIHSTPIWEGMIQENLPGTPEDIEYGTLEMATCVSELTQGKNSGSFVMKGHQDGVIAYGRSLDEAGEEILKLYRQFIKEL